MTTPPPNARPLTLGLPKGRFLESSARVLEQLNCNLDGCRRASWVTSVAGAGVVIKLLKVHDIARLLRLGRLDLGVASDDWIKEMDCPASSLVDLAWCLTSIVLALPQRAPTTAGSGRLTIATPYPNLARRHLASTSLPCDILPVSGSTEALVPEVCDGIVDCMETGQSLRDNGLHLQTVLMDSSVRLFSRVELTRAGVAELCAIFERHRKPGGSPPWRETPAATST